MPTKEKGRCGLREERPNTTHRWEVNWRLGHPTTVWKPKINHFRLEEEMKTVRRGPERKNTADRCSVSDHLKRFAGQLGSRLSSKHRGS